MSKQEALARANKAFDRIDDAVLFLREVQDELPELNQKQIGNISELISNLEASLEVCEHLLGNIKAMKE